VLCNLTCVQAAASYLPVHLGLVRLARSRPRRRLIMLAIQLVALQRVKANLVRESLQRRHAGAGSRSRRRGARRALAGPPLARPQGRLGRWRVSGRHIIAALRGLQPARARRLAATVPLHGLRMKERKIYARLQACVKGALSQ
jgi:hypothetical protein